ncbi:MAG: hypothetical protein DCF25_17765 [Leptolyngbya foveolarum]|uniref:Uncharacterized protein n=1 Tax=Leptolyngbya foveolarum TaxID=47253 RepID=A0A2W4VJH7_9CYAN|nr:MAG: hypothetical protein DCF25_17765 [Leptolyngbya foveolarum]
MISSHNDASSHRTLKKVFYHPLTLAALGVHAALILTPLNFSRLPLLVKVCVSLTILLAGLLFLVYSGAIARPISPKKILSHPLTWVALGLHALFLTASFSPEPSPIAEEVVEEESAMPVDLLNLSEIATSTPPAEPEAAPPPATPPAEPQLLPTTAPIPTPAPAPTPAPTAAPATPISQPLVNTPAPLQTPQMPIPPQQPAYNPTQDRGIFIQELDSIGEMGLNDLSGLGLPLASAFSKGNAEYFLGPTAIATDFRNPVGVGDADALPPGAASARVIDSQAKDVLKKIKAGYANTGIVFSQVSNYGSEPLYALENTTGETFAFFSLVSFQGSSLMVLWTSNPNGG